MERREVGAGRVSDTFKGRIWEGSDVLRRCFCGIVVVVADRRTVSGLWSTSLRAKKESVRSHLLAHPSVRRLYTGNPVGL